MDKIPLSMKLKFNYADINSSIVFQIVWHCTQLREALVNAKPTPNSSLSLIKEQFIKYLLGKAELDASEISAIFLKTTTNMYFESLLNDLLGFLFPLDENEKAKEITNDLKKCLISCTEKSTTTFIKMLHLNEEEFKSAINSQSDLSQHDKNRILITDYISLVKFLTRVKIFHIVKSISLKY